jgi:hypothetical protein
LHPDQEGLQVRRADPRGVKEQLFEDLAALGRFFRQKLPGLFRQVDEDRGRFRQDDLARFGSGTVDEDRPWRSDSSP